jgi:UDP-2,3-diacylglucosamine pyrophosphatase LpxH
MTHDILVFSDVHLGQKERCNADAFNQFVQALAADPPQRLVILGDLLDFWRRTNAEVLLENKAVLRDLFSLSSEIYYIVGNHDYLMGQVAKRSGKDAQKTGRVRFYKELRLESGGKPVFLTHGYDLDVQVTMEGMGIDIYETFAAAQCRAADTLGGIASLVWDSLAIAASRLGSFRRIQQNKTHTDDEYTLIYRIATSGMAHLFCGAQPGDLLVYGHTHWPYLLRDGTVANTGSWCTEAEIPVHNTYVVIDDGRMELKTFDPALPV